MRNLICAVALACAAGCTTMASKPAAPTPIRHTDASSNALQLFHDALAPYGQWWAHPHYGWVWTPDVAVASWRPYTEGRWVRTAAGATYDADVPWGWAVYHYGRWVETELGWSWIPGAVWSPAFVAWDNDANAVRWAPLDADGKAGPWTSLTPKQFASAPKLELKTVARPRRLKNAFVAVKPPELADARVDLLGKRAFLDPADEGVRPLWRVVRPAHANSAADRRGAPPPVDVTPGVQSASERDETAGTPHG